jgi:hypothetical protein
MMGSVISSFITMIVFAVIGWFAFRKSKPPRKGWVWLVLLAAVLLAGFVGVSTTVISIPGFEVHFNDCLQGLGFGVLAGLLIRKK